MALKQESQKIRVKIIESDNKFSKSKIDLIMDVSNVITLGSEIRTKTREFKKEYLKLIADAQKIIPQTNATFKNKDSKKRLKKYTKANASVYWKLGDLFRKFNENVEHEFEITNYHTALERDFGLSQIYVKELITFASLFNEKEVDDFILISVYRELVWKKIQLEKIGKLEKEKSRLLQRAKNKERIFNHKSYRKELQLLVNSGEEVKK